MAFDFLCLFTSALSSAPRAVCRLLLGALSLLASLVRVDVSSHPAWLAGWVSPDGVVRAYRATVLLHHHHNNPTARAFLHLASVDAASRRAALAVGAGGGRPYASGSARQRVCNRWRKGANPRDRTRRARISPAPRTQRRAQLHSSGAAYKPHILAKALSPSARRAPSLTELPPALDVPSTPAAALPVSPPRTAAFLASNPRLVYLRLESSASSSAAASEEGGQCVDGFGEDGPPFLCAAHACYHACSRSCPHLPTTAHTSQPPPSPAAIARSTSARPETDPSAPLRSSAQLGARVVHFAVQLAQTVQDARERAAAARHS